jgi:hypothetical protein
VLASSLDVVMSAKHADVPERVALAHTTRRPRPACRETISAGRAAIMHLQVII